MQVHEDAYPPLEGLKRNYNDAETRVKWRSKQVELPDLLDLNIETSRVRACFHKNVAQTPDVTPKKLRLIFIVQCQGISVEKNNKIGQLKGLLLTSLHAGGGLRVHVLLRPDAVSVLCTDRRWRHMCCRVCEAH